MSSPPVVRKNIVSFPDSLVQRRIFNNIAELIMQWTDILQSGPEGRGYLL
tara:strand:+ start:393 stop:542 length:150 start_codon:yes stop_codon:yes gene_type:complete